MAKNEMRRWISEATKEQLEALAAGAGTTVGTLRQIAGGYRTGGKAAVSAELALRVEHASVAMLVDSGVRPVLRGDLCAACAGCDLNRVFG